MAHWRVGDKIYTGKYPGHDEVEKQRKAEKEAKLQAVKNVISGVAKKKQEAGVSKKNTPITKGNTHDRTAKKRETPKMPVKRATSRTLTKKLEAGRRK